jgi:hypothetical protein
MLAFCRGLSRSYPAEPSIIALSPLCTVTVRLEKPLDAGSTLPGSA